MTQENILARYSVLHELGRGAIGAVYAARDRSTGVVVALKTLDPALFSEPNAKLAELFLKNARAAGRLRHRNIVRVLDAGEAGGTAYVAMELVEGESLRKMLDARPLSIARALRIFDDIASALAYAHEESMVHRGVKPSNVLVSPSGDAKLGDFGTGQIGEAALRYMSPEQVRREPLDQRSDLFSLGTVFYEMLTHRAPFEGKSPEQIRASILRAEPPRPSEVNPHVPAVLDGMVLSLLAARPDRRFADARSLLRDLQRLEEGLGLRPAASAGAGKPAPSAPPREPEQQAPAPAAEEESQHRIQIPRGMRFDPPDARFAREREPGPEPRSGSWTSALAAIALLLAVLSIGLTVFLYYSPDSRELPAVASRTQEAPVAAAVPSPPTAPAPAAEAIKPPAEPIKPPAEPIEQPAAAPAPEASTAPTESLPALDPEQTATGATAPPQEKPRPQPGGTAKLILAVSPQGEIYVDGKHYGTTPPLTTLDLEPGMHRIEIRSGSRKPYLTYVTVEAGDERRIRHDFNAKPIRPPA